MDVSSVVTSTASIASAVKQLQTINKMQIEVMKSLADSQAQVADMVQASSASVGQNINIHA